MKKIYPLLLLTFLCGKVFSQSCISLGCANQYTGIATDGALSDSTIVSDLGCYNGFDLKQIFWEFFFSPSGGDFTQTFTPTSGTDLALNYVIFDEGTTAPSSVDCPVDASTWIQLACDLIDHPNQPSGPGLFGVTATTTSGHYYAVAIINWQGISDGHDSSYTFDLSVPQLGGVDLDAGSCPGVLPVKLSSFTGDIKNCVVNLNWVAQLQSNFKSYEVQTSTNGLHFQTISIISGKTQGADQEFSYKDLDVKQGNNFYRLKMTDVDGKTAYSKIVSVNNTCNRNMFLTYPNPVRGILTVRVPDSPNGLTLARLYSSSGKLVYSATFQNGINSINMSTYSSGVYLLNLKNTLETQNIKIVK